VLGHAVHRSGLAVAEVAEDGAADDEAEQAGTADDDGTPGQDDAVDDGTPGQDDAVDGGTPGQVDADDGAAQEAGAGTVADNTPAQGTLDLGEAHTPGTRSPSSRVIPDRAGEDDPRSWGEREE